MAGEFIFFVIYVAQQLGIMLGVGSMTVLLFTHLIAVRHGEQESPHASNAAAARKALYAGFFLIITSGAAAVVVHVFSGGLDVLFAPAFMFKWFLIGAALWAFFRSNQLSRWSNTLAGFAGGTWYALFLVHSLGPVTTWTTLIILYVFWLLFFLAVWAGVVWLMRFNKKQPAPVEQKPAPRPYIPPPPPRVVVAPPSFVPKPVPPPPPKPVPPPVFVPPPPPKPVPPPAPRPAPPPAPKPPQPPAPAPVAHKTGVIQDIIDHMLVPALRIMPQTPADIGKHNRPPVVKLSNG